MLTPLALAAVIAAGPAAPDPAQPYTATTANPVTTAVDFRVAVTAPPNTKVLKVWVPVPRTDAGQVVEQSGFATFPAAVAPSLHTEGVFGNRFAYFEFANPQGAQVITHTFRCTVWEQAWAVDPAKVAPVTDWPPAFAPFRRGERLIRVDGPFAELAEKLAADKPGPADRLGAVADWVQANLTYDHAATSLSADSTHALEKRRGDCSDYHGLCSSLGRALGVPTRVAYGLHLFPKNLPSHCKLEAFLAPYGWVSFDVSETQRLVKRIQAAPALSAAEKQRLTAAAQARFRRGFRDNTWLLVTKGTDYELAPKASGKVPLVGTIHAEADGVPLPTPDPADPTKREFAWMTAHRYAPDRAVPYPFADWSALKP